MPMATEAKVRAQLGRFGFGVDKAETPVENLSGEKARLLFSLITRDAPHIMFLDEPTTIWTWTLGKRWWKPSTATTAPLSWSVTTPI